MRKERDCIVLHLQTLMNKMEFRDLSDPLQQRSWQVSCPQICMLRKFRWKISADKQHIGHCCSYEHNCYVVRIPLFKEGSAFLKMGLIGQSKGDTQKGQKRGVRASKRHDRPCVIWSKKGWIKIYFKGQYQKNVIRPLFELGKHLASGFSSL